MKDKTVAEIIEEVCEEVCDNLCKYADTTDESLECAWIRMGNTCPLDKLN